jgi:polyhydroxybutyrate depolymerase
MSFIRPFYVKRIQKGGGKMVLKKYCIIALLVIMAMVLPVGSPVAVADNGDLLPSGSMDYGGYTRTWRYYVPTSYNESEEIPLVFSFHGLGSSGAAQEDLTSFANLAEEEGFIVVFPDATVLQGYHPILPLLPGANIQWNLGGPGSLQYQYDVDDLGFISELVDKFKTDYNIAASRIYATGMSNGAMLTYYVAMNLPGTFAGFAAVCSPMTLNLFEPYMDFDLDVGCPVTMILMQGTADPIVDYDGMPGVTGSVNQTIDYWKDVNNTTTGPVETVWGPTEEDSTIVTRYVYSGGTNGTEVILYKVQGGGHTWPGGPQYASEFLIGYVTTHIDGSAEIWNHLKEHALPPLPPVRKSPKVVTAGEEFEVTITFAAPAANFTDITLTDTAPVGWNVSVDTTWTDPDADGAQTPESNKAEYTWDGPYDEGTAFTAVYKVKVPDAAAAGNYAFAGSLEYSVGEESDEVTIAGNTRVQVVEEYNLTINCGTGGSVTMPSTGTFIYRAGKVVYLKAEPDTGYDFVNWTGDVGTIPTGDTTEKYTTITMEGDYEITAEFEKLPPTVTTRLATGITTDSATLKMDYTLGGFSTVEVRFAYKNSAEQAWSYTDWGSKAAAGSHDEALTGLAPNTEYEFKAQLKYNDTMIEGIIREFTTATTSPTGCFIATAAYGTSTAEQLDVLREFRDGVLLESTVGSQLVDLYYQLSPPIADFISEHDVLRTLVRELLVDPVVWLVEATGDIWRS